MEGDEEFRPWYTQACRFAEWRLYAVDGAASGA